MRNRKTGHLIIGWHVTVIFIGFLYTSTMYDQLILEPTPTNLPTSSNDLIFNDKLDLQIFGDTELFMQLKRVLKFTKLDVGFKTKFALLLKKVKTVISSLGIFIVTKHLATDSPLDYHCDYDGSFWLQKPNCKTSAKDFALITNNRLRFKEVLYTFSKRRIYINNEMPILVTHRLRFCYNQYFFRAFSKTFVSLIESGLYGKWMEYENKVSNYLSFKRTRRFLSDFNENWNLYTLALLNRPTTGTENVNEIPVQLKALGIVLFLYWGLLIISGCCAIMELLLKMSDRE